MKEQEEPTLDDYISEEERERLLAGLHRFLIWVGEQVPEDVLVNGKNIKLHELIWRCVHNRELTDDEKKRLSELAQYLETKEKRDEEALRKASLTRQEAKRLYDESASLIRAIMDLRECESGKIKLKESRDEIRQKIDDARRWICFLKNVGKKN
jgi:hypothetical protein